MSIRDQLQDEFERGKPWNPRKDPSAPNPLYSEDVKWSRGATAHGDADFLVVRDDDATFWSNIVGPYRLRKDLLEGEVSRWDAERNAFVVTDVIGPVQPGELVAIEYRGERQFTAKDGRKVTAADYRTVRKRGVNDGDGQGAEPEPSKPRPRGGQLGPNEPLPF